MKKFLVIGNPIEHSLSPVLHNYWIKKNGTDAIYEKKKLNVEGLDLIISQVKEKKINGKILGPVSAPIFRLKRKYRVRLLNRGPKTLKLQNSLALIIQKYKFQSGIKLSVDVDPISFN